MRAKLKSWKVKELGPALSTRREHGDGSVTYEAVSMVNLEFSVVGNDAQDFLKLVRQLNGHHLKSITFSGKPIKGMKLKLDRPSRKFDFSEEGK